MTRIERTGLYALPIAWLAAATLPFWFAWQRLPDPMASHWSLLGPANDSLPRISLLALHAGASLLSAIATWVLIGRAPSPRGTIAPALGVAAFIGTLFGGLAVLVTALNRDAPTWHDARPMSLPALAAVLLAAAAIASLVSRRARTLEVAAASRSPLPSIGLTPGEQALWIGTARNRWLDLVAVAFVAIAAAQAAIGPPWSALGFLIAAVACASVARIRLTLDRRGLRIAFGPLHFPRMSIALRRISEARAIRLTPWSWGYRGSLRLVGRAAIIVRGGDTLDLQLDGGKRLSITVDDATTAAGLVNDLVAREHA